MEKETKAYMERYRMTSCGDGILAGLSGGADSVCLVYLLKRLSGGLGTELRAVHVNHGLRGAEADRDEAFSRSFCEALEIPFQAERIDAAAEAAAGGCSVEEAGRLARYRILEREAASWERELGRPVHIATAHHADDNVETILFHLFRGSGLKGLGGIAPVRGRVIRPLLWAKREQIAAYLNREGLSWVEDSSNREPVFARNRLRLEILPLIREAVNERAGEHILQAGAWIREADDYFTEQAVSWAEEHAPDGRVSGRLFDAEPEILKGYLARELLRRAGCPLRDVTARHVKAFLDLAKAGTGKQICLPYGFLAENEYGIICIRRQSEAGKSGPDSGRAGEDPPEKKDFRFRVFPCENAADFPKKQYTKWFDYDKIKQALCVRNRRPGDYFVLPDGGRKTLKSYLIDEKIPRGEREKLLLLADGSHVLWIVGRRISAAYRVTEETKTILQAEYLKGAEPPEGAV